MYKMTKHEASELIFQILYPDGKNANKGIPRDDFMKLLFIQDGLSNFPLFKSSKKEKKNDNN